MSRFRVRAGVAAGAALSVALLSVLPVAAQAGSATDASVTEVTGVEYAYTGLPTSVPAGTSLGFTNAGAEVHELVLVRIADGVTATLDELLAMEEDPMEAGLVEMIGEMPLFAAPGAAADGTLPLDREGRYVAICFIPQGLTDMAILEQLGPDANPEELPEDVQAIMANPPHFALGMIQEFTVTAADSTPGPIPAMDEPTAEEPKADASPAA